MRKSIAAAAALVLAACNGPNGIQETASSVPHRDLTLTSSSAPSVEVASRIELATTPTAHRTKARPTARVRAPAPSPEPETPVVVPVASPKPTVVAPAAPTPVALTPQSDPTGHELAPGATVTMIPASTGASSGSEGGDWSEAPRERNRGGVMIGGGHGGRCGGGRGRGPVSILE